MKITRTEIALSLVLTAAMWVCPTLAQADFEELGEYIPGICASTLLSPSKHDCTATGELASFTHDVRSLLWIPIGIYWSDQRFSRGQSAGHRLRDAAYNVAWTPVMLPLGALGLVADILGFIPNRIYYHVHHRHERKSFDDRRYVHYDGDRR